MSQKHYQALLQDRTDSEKFVRQTLSALEFDFRLISLLLLREWESLGLVSRDLFTPVSALQRPSWGTWNWILTAILSSRRSVLRDGSGDARESVIRSAGLNRIVSFLDARIATDEKSRIQSVAELCQQTMGEAPKSKDVLSLPITIRNRIVHDNPTDRNWWNDAANALALLVQWCLENDAYCDLTATQPLQTPWFITDDDQDTWTFNGLEKNLSVIYVNREGKSFRSNEASEQVIQAFQRLLGKSNIQSSSFRKLLASLAPEEAKGVLIDDYLLCRPVGSGAFGIVHMGRQLSTGRPVAIKVLRDGASDITKMRFRQEAGLLSKIDCPHVVSVYSYGEAAWVPPNNFTLADEAWFQEFKNGSPIKCYIAMEWVAGQTLEDVFNAAPEEWPSLERITKWFVQAAYAVRTVHTSGLIHRDIKPANLMIAEDDQLMLMDFGIARQDHEARTLVTTDGVSLGTPAYMSPEQLRAVDADNEVGPRTDIYSLCATFYELYTHRRLYEHDTESADSVRLHKIQGNRPRRPSALGASLPWELETILLGGLETELSDRYASAAELEDDLQRYQMNEPLRYKRPSLTRRTVLFYRRHRTVVNLVAGFLFLIGLGTGFYTQHINHERRRAESSLKVASDTVDRFLTRVSEEELLGTDGLQPLRKRLLEDALHYYKVLLKDYTKTESLDESTAKAYRHVAEIENLIGDSQAAIVNFEKSLVYWNSKYKADPESMNVQDELQSVLWDLAVAQREAGESEQALANMQRAVGIQEQLVAKQPDFNDAERVLLAAYSNLGPFQRAAGRFTDAESTYHKAWLAYDAFVSKQAYCGLFVETQTNGNENNIVVRKTQRHTSAAEKIQPGDIILSVEGKVVKDAEELNSFANAKQAGESLRLSIRRNGETRVVSLRLEPLADPLMAILALNAGILHSEVNHDLSMAMQWFTRALRILERLADMIDEEGEDPFPKSGEGGNMVEAAMYQTLSAMARVKVSMNEQSEAVELFERSLAVSMPIAQKNPAVLSHQSSIVTDLFNLASIHRSNDRTEAAKKHFQDALAHCLILVKGNPGNARFSQYLAAIHESLGDIAAQQKEPEAGVMHYCESLIALDDRWQLKQGSVAKGLPIATTESGTIALDFADGSNDALRIKFAELLNNAGALCFEEDNLVSATEAFETILSLYSTSGEVVSPAPDAANLIARAYGNLAWADFLKKDFASSIEQSTKALAIDDSHQWIELNLALAYVLDGQYENAKLLYMRLSTESEDRMAFASELSQEFELVRMKGIDHPDLGRILKFIQSEGD